MLMRVVKKPPATAAIYEFGCADEGCGRKERNSGPTQGIAAHHLREDHRWGPSGYPDLQCPEHAPPPGEQDLRRMMLGHVEGTLGMPARFEDWPATHKRSPVPDGPKRRPPQLPAGTGTASRRRTRRRKQRGSPTGNRSGGERTVWPY